MTSEQKSTLGKWTGAAVALVAALPVLNFLAQHAPGVTSWVLLNLQILWGVTYVKNGVAVIVFSTLFALSLPYALSLRGLGRPDMSSARAHASVRLFTSLVAFTLGVYLDPTRPGFIFALGYAMAAPFASMIIIRFLQRFEWFRPLSLEPTPQEANAVMQRAAEAATKEP